MIPSPEAVDASAERDRVLRRAWNVLTSRVGCARRWNLVPMLKQRMEEEQDLGFSTQVTDVAFS